MWILVHERGFQYFYAASMEVKEHPYCFPGADLFHLLFCATYFPGFHGDNFIMEFVRLQPSDENLAAGDGISPLRKIPEYTNYYRISE
jgi:hypothetical protein